MSQRTLSPTRWTAAVLVLASIAILFPGSALAAPGAHGPNGEHLDGPITSAGAADITPRLEAKSEAFELVGRLHADEFSMLINRFETNEPVLNAQVEVETGNVRAMAKFHADLGDYAVDDKAFLDAVNAKGPHPLVITVISGSESDLLDGTLVNAGKGGKGDASAAPHADDAAHGHSHGMSVTAWLAVGLAFFLVIAVLLGMRRTSSSSKPQGEPS